MDSLEMDQYMDRWDNHFNEYPFPYGNRHPEPEDKPAHPQPEDKPAVGRFDDER